MKIQILILIGAVNLLAAVPFGLNDDFIPYDRINWPGARIIGGWETNITEYPHQCSLQRNSRHSCGGNIISETFVITAAHCTYASGVSGLTIRAGSSAHRTGGVVVEIARIIQHPQYDPNVIDYDYSLLQLKTPLVYSDVIQPIKIICQGQDFPAGTDTDVVGWGNTNNIAESSEILRAVQVAIIDQKECSDMYSKIGAIITDSGLKEGGKDACQGDSGGPILFSESLELRCLIGLVSWGYGCARPLYPGVYSRISYVSNWIMREAGLTTCFDINQRKIRKYDTPLMRDHFY